jgi:hypothetical protein
VGQEVQFLRDGTFYLSRIMALNAGKVSGLRFRFLAIGCRVHA